MSVFIPLSDYLSEITMSLLAAVKNKRPELGFTPDFLESVAPHLAEIKRRGIRVITNGGGYNSSDCTFHIFSLCRWRNQSRRLHRHAAQPCQEVRGGVFNSRGDTADCPLYSRPASDVCRVCRCLVTT